MARRKKLGKNLGAFVTTTADAAENLNVLSWGKSGAGKTYLAGTASRPFIIAAESGTMTLAEKGFPMIALSNDVEIYDTIQYIIKAARNKEIIADEDGNQIVDFNNVDTIVLDSITKLNELLIKEIEEEVGHKLQLQDWGLLRSRIQDCVCSLNSLPYDTHQTMGEAVGTDQEDEDKIEILPNFQGSFKHNVFYEFDFVLYHEYEKRGSSEKYVVHTKPYKGRVAKARIGLPAKIENCTFTKLKDAVSAARGAK